MKTHQRRQKRPIPGFWDYVLLERTFLGTTQVLIFYTQTRLSRETSLGDMSPDLRLYKLFYIPYRDRSTLLTLDVPETTQLRLRNQRLRIPLVTPLLEHSLRTTAWITRVLSSRNGYPYFHRVMKLSCLLSGGRWSRVLSILTFITKLAEEHPVKIREERLEQEEFDGD